MYLRFERGFSVTGTVRDIHGLAIAQANVVLSATGRTEFDLPRFVWPQWLTDKDGVFKAIGLAAGRYTALANAEGHVMLDDIELEIPEAADRVEITMAPAFHVEGGVVGAIDYQPVVGAEVEAHASGPVRIVETDSHGRFRVGPFAVGQEVRVAAHSNDGRSSDTVHLSKPQERLVLRLNEGVRVTGAVADGTNNKVVTGFVLTAYANGDVLGSFPFRDTGGKLDAVVDWRTDTLAVEVPGYSAWSARAQFTAGEHFDLGRILVEPHRPVSGLVIDGSTGTPIAGATVTRHGVYLSYTQRLGGETTITDGAGTFQLSNASSDGYSLSVSVDGYAHKTIDFRGTADHVTIELERGGTVIGTLSTTDGTPIGGILTLSPSGETRLQGIRERAASDGRFEFTNVRAGVYRLFARSTGSVPRNRLVTVTDGRPTRVNVALDAGLRMTGELSGLSDGERARFLFSRGGEHVHVVSGRHGNGRFVVEGVPSGPLQVTAATSIGRKMTKVVDDETGYAGVDFAFGGGSVLRGVVRAGDTPMSAIAVTVVRQEGEAFSSSTNTDRAGFYELRGLPAGDYVLTVQQRSATFHDRFDVAVAGDTVFDVPLTPLTISGVVRSFRSVYDGRIRATKLTEAGMMSIVSRIKSGGSYRFDGLAAGRWRITVLEPFADGITQSVDLQGVVSEFDFTLTPSGTQAIWIAPDLAGDRPPMLEVVVESGDLAGEVIAYSLDNGANRQLPLSLVGQRLRFEAGGYLPQTVESWGGGTLEIELRQR
ncbi:MAG: carboxypeptidase regulatory-like domain-containing protein [Gammaproteobacteria bacterium]|nr:carboxypeptidase regulatory-like domain-containing protein [Gammaproteobacteria bacterium]